MPVLYLTEQGATLKKEGDCFLITKDGQVFQEVPAMKVEQIIVLGNVNLTTPVIHYLLKEGIECVFCSSYGKYHGRLFSNESKFGALRQRQFQKTVDPLAKLAAAREIVRGKLLNQRTFLMRYFRKTQDPQLDSTVESFKQCLKQVDEIKDIGALLGLEGYTSTLYFQSLRALLGQKLGFVSRARRPPPDPVNSLLSFGYTLLTYDMQTAVQTVGLDPFLGFLHATEYSRPSLALDLIEEFRTIVTDSVVLRLINTQVITKEDFEPPQGPKKGVFLTQEGIKKFLHHYEERVQTLVFHPTDRVRVTYRRCFNLQSRHIARYIMGQEIRYQPFLVK